MRKLLAISVLVVSAAVTAIVRAEQAQVVARGDGAPQATEPGGVQGPPPIKPGGVQGPPPIQNDWPQWRGPLANGVSTDASLPLKWSAKENIAWTAALGGLGVSTPIVIGDRVIVTSQIGTGVRRPGNHPRLTQGGDAAAAGERAIATGAESEGKTVFAVEAFSFADGRRLWQHRLDAIGTLTGVHDKHNLATPSPASDGSLIYAWFGTGQLVALTPEGKVAWQRHLGQEISPFDIQWGHASSPMVHGDLLFLLCDHAPASYLLAVDKRTGKERWRADRGKGRASYSTPFVVKGPKGEEVLVNSNERVDAYDVANGKHLWHTGGANRFPIPVPVVHDGIIYMSRGYRSGPYLAMRPGGQGDVTASHVVWSVETGAPYVSSLVFANGLLFMANDTGIDAKNGERVWQHRVPGVFSASPIATTDRVYFMSEGGRTIVMRAGRTAEVLAENDLDARLIASPAASRGRLFLRSDDRIFAVGK
jgi:outer membrane protein assembly factor BamB